MDVTIFFNEAQRGDGTPMGGGEWYRSLEWPDGIKHGVTMYPHLGSLEPKTPGPWCCYEPHELRTPGLAQQLIASVPGALARHAVHVPWDWTGDVIIDIERFCLRRVDQQAREDGQMRWRGWRDGVLDRYDAAVGKNGANVSYDSDTGSFLCGVLQSLHALGHSAGWYGLPDYKPSRTEDVAELKKHPVIRNQKLLMIVHYLRDPNHTFEQWRDETMLGIERARRIAPGKRIMVLHSFNHIYHPHGFVAPAMFNRCVEFLAQGFKDVELGIWDWIEKEEYLRIFQPYVRDVAPTLAAVMRMARGANVGAASV